MSARGVFAVDRGIWEHPVFAREPFSEREAFIWLVGEAAFRSRRVRLASGAIVELARGQLAHSLRFMASKWCWSEARCVGISPLEKRRNDRRSERRRPDCRNHLQL